MGLGPYVKSWVFICKTSIYVVRIYCSSYLLLYEIGYAAQSMRGTVEVIVMSIRQMEKLDPSIRSSETGNFHRLHFIDYIVKKKMNP